MQGPWIRIQTWGGKTNKNDKGRSYPSQNMHLQLAIVFDFLAKKAKHNEDNYINGKNDRAQEDIMGMRGSCFVFLSIKGRNIRTGSNRRQWLIINTHSKVEDSARTRWHKLGTKLL